MLGRLAYRRGESFSDQAQGFARPLYVMAHHDDEILAAGLLQRLGSSAQVVWVTNSDGLYFETDLSPQRYAAVRKAEGLQSLAAIGIAPAQTRNLDFSEVDIYRHLSELHAQPGRLEEIRPFFDNIRQAVQTEIFRIQPDAVFTLAWQGGHPEHDLVHFFTRLALWELQKQTGQKPAFFHLPAYEYTILLALRFHPFYQGERIRLRLSSSELAKKMEMIQAYPSQQRLFGDFRRVFKWLMTPIGLLTQGPKTIEEFLSTEEFGPVPVPLNYRVPPHRLDFFSYMFDDFEGSPVSFSRSILPLVDSYLKSRD